jgi:diguanylate cyclase (GGDEF)-like protein
MLFCMTLRGRVRLPDVRHRSILRNGVRIGVLLALLAVVPLGGAAWFAAGEFRTASEARSQVDPLDESANRLIKLTELRTRVIDEQNWSTALLGLQVIGIDPDLASQLSSINIVGEYTDSTTAVDRLISELALSDLEADLARIRQNMSDVERMDELNLGFQQVERAVVELTEAELDILTGIAASVSDGAELMTSLRVLDAAGEARQSLAAQLIGYFTAQFSEIIDFDSTIETLVVQRSTFLAATAEIDRLAPPQSAVTAIRAQITEEGESAEFGVAVDAQIASQLSARGESTELDLSALIGQLEESARRFAVGSQAADLHFDLLEAAGADVTSSGQVLEAAAARDQASAQRIILVLLVASGLLGLVVTSSIARPLRDLEEAAKGLQNGAASSSSDPRGPVEIRRAAQGLDEAAAHLRLAERQAMALADGDLEHSSLAQNAPGALGASLQSAVRTLTTSLNEREQYRRRLAHEAAHDTLTQLPNRKASLSRLRDGMARTSRTDTCLAVLFLDLDGFKDVNDQHGHQAGDVVLQVTAQRLLDTVREGDHVGRLGGDEFLIIAEPVGGVDDAVILGERILSALTEPIQTENAVVAVNASIGIAIPSQTGLTADEILRDADLAVYKAKDAGKGRIELCDESLRDAMVNRAELESALRRAIAGDELELDFQPIIDATTGDLISVEALVRWNRPGEGRLPPVEFIPFAERSELITEIDQWVMRRVAGQLSEWTDNERMGSIPVAVNVSARHLAADSFVPHMLSTLRDHDVDPARVIVEVTESAVLSDLRDAAEKLEQLRGNGVKVAIDDFGTGYTSLAHLKSLPIDILKIDRSFTNDPTSQSLVKLIIDTGHLLGARITAEGVETSTVADDLTDMGSDELQGFLYGRPVGPDQLERLGSEVAATPHPATGS